MDKLEKIKIKLEVLGYETNLRESKEGNFIRCSDNLFSENFPKILLIIIIENEKYVVGNRMYQVPPIWRFDTEEEALSFIKEKFPLET